MIEVDGPKRGVATVTIANPGRRNALDLAMFRALAATWRRLEADDTVRVIVVTGADDCFSSGADLSSISTDMSAAIAEEADERGADDRSPGRRAWSDVNDAVLRGVRMSTPVIAAVEGICYGAGMELVGATDLRIAGRSARFALPEVRYGLVAGGGTLARLARQIPYAAAMRLLLTGQPATADDLHRLGYLNEVVADGTTLAAAHELAAVIADNSPAAVRAVKLVVQGSLTDDLAAAFELEEQATREVLAGPDAAEGARAFLAKRAPAWRLD
jgi:enoyl-CoA hydratase